MKMEIIQRLIKKIEIGFRGKFTIEEAFELEKIFKNVETEKQLDEIYHAICDAYKYAKLPNLGVIVRVVQDVGLRKKMRMGTLKICDCGKCIEGSVSVFDLRTYLFYEHECGGWKKGGIDGICAIPRMSTWCYNFRPNKRNIHTHLEEIQDYESQYFEFAYIRLWREFCSMKTFMEFEKFNPYAFWGLGNRSRGMRRMAKSQIVNKFLCSEIEENEKAQRDEVSFDIKKITKEIPKESFENFMDKSNQEFQNKLIGE